MAGRATAGRMNGPLRERLNSSSSSAATSPVHECPDSTILPWQCQFTTNFADQILRLNIGSDETGGEFPAVAGRCFA
jgi:hypothetical protein